MINNAKNIFVFLGCLLGTILCIFGIYFINDFEHIIKIKIGETYSFSSWKKIKTINEMYRVREATATLSIAELNLTKNLNIEGISKLKEWNLNEVKVVVVKVKGIPIISGRTKVDIKVNIVVPKNHDLVGKKGTLKVEGKVEYPYYSIIEGAVGSAINNVKYRIKTTQFSREQDVIFIDQGKSGRKAGILEKILAGIMIVFAVLTISAFGNLVGSKK
ncbi:hypothetical protein [Candidatus Uabimicrobium sp. HlEnr_7]|uniref:hypothetical protein n=1 Tax=Candidatus Uabimicrobium helgolandensis TaxID=3095367 RepID=UPI003557C30F